MPSATVATPPQILATLDRLRSLSQRDVRDTWHHGATPGDLPPTAEVWMAWPLAPLSDCHHIVWLQGRLPLWLHQRFTWPRHLNGYPLQGLVARLALRWWADRADIFINGNLVQTGDIFDCWTRIVLTDRVVPGESVDVALKLISPGHDEGALVEATLMFEVPEDPLESWATLGPEPGFVAEELGVLATYLAQFQPERLEELDRALAGIAWDAIADCIPGSGSDRRDRFQRSLLAVRETLKHFSPWLKKRTIHCLGHAHLDLAWLWPVADTWEAAEQTFRSVLALQQEFPELTFSHSSPALFAWLEQHRPELFATIQAQVKTGRWAIDAGLWVEPDLNLPGGEAIARQILYGQRYCAEKFGAVSAIAWLPDTFGFSWQLPQLLTQGGIRYFATQKLRWNDTNPFPHDLFAWQGRDGTAIAGVTLPPIGTDLDPLAMAQYACGWEANTGLAEALWLPGVGDHGGGPTRDMLQKAQRWARSPFFPTLAWGHAVPLFDRLAQNPGAGQTQGSAPTAIHPSTPAPQHPSTPAVGQTHRSAPTAIHSITPSPPYPSTPHPLPPWDDELYLELHRGCYTTHGDQKQYNRRCEDTLFQAELFASIAAISGLQSYPQAELETSWKQVLFNQFHDILPGTSIPEVFDQANEGWQAALETGDRILRTSLQALAQRCPQPSPPHADAVPVVLFNPLNWARSEVVAIALEPALLGQQWQAQDASGRPLPTQFTQSPTASLLVYVSDLPSVGYQLLWLIPSEEEPTQPPPPDWRLENDHLRATIDPATGQIASLIHKATGRDTFQGNGNQIQVFQDQGQYWDAWNIAPDYQDHPLPPAQVKSIEWVDYGPLRQTLRVVYRLNQSTITQDYGVEAGSPLLTVHSQVDWQETQVVLKVAFPLTVSTPEATYEIPFGAIARATTSTTPQAAAEWEVPALRWADLSDGERGVSILTDYKHGFDATPNQLRLTLLKAPLWPDPGCDRGLQTFRYAIYPHGQSWQQANTVQTARNFNLPVLPLVQDQSPTTGIAPTQASYLNLGDSSLVISAFKRAEDSKSRYILRGYESLGVTNSFSVSSSLPLTVWGQTDGLEQPLEVGTDDNPEGNRYGEIALRPWQVVSLAIDIPV